MAAKKKKKRRDAGTICVTIIMLAFIAVMSVQIVKLKQKDDNYAQIEQEKKELLEQETQRASEIIELEEYMKSSQYVEDTAKSKLGLAYENEIIFKEME